MANPTATDDSYLAPADQVLRVGQGEFVGRGQLATLRIRSLAATLSSTPVTFAGVAAASRMQLRSAAGSIDLSATTPTTVTTLSVSPSVTGSGLPVTFGHAFAVGAVPAGAEVEVFGRTTQCNLKATHADGSARHAILTALIDVTAGVPQSVQLRTRAPVGGVALTKANVLASAFSASVSLDVAGTIYTLAARDLLDGTITPSQDLTHLSGPQCSEFIIGAAVRNGVTPHAHLTAYFHIRAYGSAGNVTRVRCDVVVENNWILEPSPAQFAYTATVVVGGSTIYSGALTHWHHTRWHQVGWWGGDPQVYVAHNRAYLKSTKAIPNYGAATPTEGALAALATAQLPLDNGELTDIFSNTGAQDQIGPMHRWAALASVTTDRRAFLSTLRQDSGGATYAMHYRDKVTGYPARIDDHPTISEAEMPAVVGGSTNPYSHDGGHAPLLGYMSYLTTGDYFYLEELQMWASYAMWYPDPVSRNYADGLFYDGTLRGQAWAYRTLGYAAYITPDGHQQKTYLNAKIGTNLAHDLSLYVTPGTSPSKTIFGTMHMAEGNEQYRSWMDDFFTWAIGNLVDLGFTQAKPLMDYKVKFPIGRMGADTTGQYCFQFGPSYTHQMGPTATTWHATWAQIYAAQTVCPDVCGTPAMATWLSANSGEGTFVQHQTTGYQFGYDGYAAVMQPALAMAAQSGVAGGGTAWARFKLSTVQPNYNDFPQWGIEPRVPSWYAGLPVRKWYAFPNSIIESTYPGIGVIMYAWGGGTYDSDRDQLIAWGGGHTDYSGNEVYAFGSLNSETPTWSRLTNPSSPPANNTSYAADGRPVSRHSQDLLTYLPSPYNKMMSAYCVGNYSNGFSIPMADLYDFTINGFSGQPWSAAATPPTSVYPGATYVFNPKTNRGWFHSVGGAQGGLHEYNPDLNTWTTHALYESYSNQSGAIDTRRNVLAVIQPAGTGPGGVRIHNLNTPAVQPYFATTSGANPEQTYGPGFVYDPVNDRFLAWAGGTTIYALSIPSDIVNGTWTWTTLTLDAGNTVVPAAQSNQGTYKRFNYVPSLHGLILANAGGESVYFVKL